jgi:mono/diheme cytochrome c family protein
MKARTHAARAVALGGIALLALSTGCSTVAGGSSQRSVPVAEQEPLSPSQQRGRQLFNRYCEACHPHGNGGIGGTLNTKPFPEAALRLKVRTGLGLDMPTFSADELPEPDLDAIVEYVQTLRSHDPVTDNPEEIERKN